MRRAGWIGIGVTLLVSIVAGGVYLKESDSAGAQAKGPRGAALVKVVTVQPRNLTHEVVAPGVVEASEIHEVRAPWTTARVRLLVGEGEHVKAGQVIAELDRTDMEAEVAVQEAVVARAEAALAEARAQRSDGSAAREQIRAAEAELSAVSLRLKRMRDRLEQAKLKAPSAGMVLARGLENDRPAQEGQLLVTLGNLDTLVVRIRVDEIDVGNVRLGQPLSVRSNAYGHERFTGQITRMAVQSSLVWDGAAGVFFEMQGEVDNHGTELRSGMTVEARIQTEARENVVAVGRKAVREAGEEAFVLVVKEFQVEVRPVKVGLRTQTEAEILEGLQAGEQIIVSPLAAVRSLKTGAPVRMEEVEQEEEAAQQASPGHATPVRGSP